MTRTLHLTIDSQPDCVELLSTAVRGLCQITTLTEADIASIELALVEAINNVVEHAYHGESGHPVMVEVNLSPESLMLRISDQGSAMDPRQLDQSVQWVELNPVDPDTWNHRGRGLAIIKSCMETVEYCIGDSRNTLIMSRTLPDNG